MSSFDRRIFLTSLLALGACGFAPVYGPGSEARALQGAIEVDPPGTRPAYDLVRQLEARLGQPSAPRYRLSYQIDTQVRNVGVTSAEETSRRHILGTIRYQVKPITGDEVLLADSVSTFTAYINTGTTVSAATQQRDAQRRLMVALADQIATRLTATAADWAT